MSLFSVCEGGERNRMCMMGMVQVNFQCLAEEGTTYTLFCVCDAR